MMRLDFRVVICNIFIFLIFSSCKNEARNNIEEDASTYKLSIRIYPIDLPKELRCEFIIVDDTLKGVDYEDENFSILRKEIKLNSDQLNKIMRMSDSLIYKEPFSGLVTDSWEIQILVNDKIRYHQRDFGRGEESVDKLLDYIFEILDFDIRIYSFSKD